MSFSTQISSVWHGTLVKLLRSLYLLRLPESTRELQSVEQEVRWRLRRLRYKHLAFLAESCASMQTESSSKLLAELLVHLERRWTEIEDSRMLVAIMTKAGHLSELLMTRLEDKVRAESWQKGFVCLATETLEPLVRSAGVMQGAARGLQEATGGHSMATLVQQHYQLCCSVWCVPRSLLALSLLSF